MKIKREEMQRREEGMEGWREGHLSPGFFNRLSGTAGERGRDRRGRVRNQG